LEIKHGKFDHMPIVVQDLQPVFGFTRAQHNLIGFGQPIKMRAQRLLGAGVRDHIKIRDLTIRRGCAAFRR